MAKTSKRFSDVMPKIEFHKDLAQIDLNDALDNEYQITDAIIVKDFDSKFGKSDFALLLLVDPETGDKVTTLCGGMVVVKKIAFALENNLLPLTGTITYNETYYDIN